VTWTLERDTPGLFTAQVMESNSPGSIKPFWFASRTVCPARKGKPRAW